MDVTRDNFTAVLDPLLERIAECDYYSLDLEMTGINAPDTHPELPTMTLEELYRSKHFVASRFGIIQVGLCLFKHTSDTEVTARPYNVFVFPASISDTPTAASVKPTVVGAENARDVVLSPSAIEFLRKHGMDFQRWMYRGVPYTDREGAARVTAELEAEKNQEAAMADATGLLTDKEWSWVDQSIKLAARVVGEEGKKLPYGKEIPLPAIQSANACSALRAMIRGKPEWNGVDVLIRGRYDAKDASLVRRHASDAQGAAKQLLMDRIGFRQVFTALVESKKPIIGHHFLADLLFTLKAFEGPLPPTVKGFSDLATSLFAGGVYDTKYMACYTDPTIMPPSRFESTGLGSLYSHYGPSSQHVNIGIPEGFQSYHPATMNRRGRSAAHEAGYDALMTGTIFANLCAEFPGIRDAARNKVSVFNSLYAMDVEACASGLSPDGAELVARGEVLHVTHPWGGNLAAVTQAIPGATQLMLNSTTGNVLVVLETAEALQRAEQPSPLLGATAAARKQAMRAADVLDNIASAKKNADLGGTKSPLSRVTATLFKPSPTVVSRAKLVHPLEVDAATAIKIAGKQAVTACGRVLLR